MTPEPLDPIVSRHRLPKVVGSVLLLSLAAFFAGCARDRAAITPTTTGTDFSQIPRGHMGPQPFPGSSLADRATASPRGRIAPDAPILTSGGSDAILR